MRSRISKRGCVRPSVFPSIHRSAGPLVCPSIKSVHRLVTHELKSCKSAAFVKNNWQYKRGRILCRVYGLDLSKTRYTPTELMQHMQAALSNPRIASLPTSFDVYPVVLRPRRQFYPSMHCLLVLTHRFSFSREAPFFIVILEKDEGN